MSRAVDAAIAAARAQGATVTRLEAAPGVEVLVVAVPASPTESGEAMLPIVEAARSAGTSLRVVRDAIRTNDLPAYGRQRDRSVRRADLDRWIESRRVRPIEGPADGDIEKRVERLARAERRRRTG